MKKGDYVSRIISVEGLLDIPYLLNLSVGEYLVYVKTAYDKTEIAGYLTKEARTQFKFRPEHNINGTELEISITDGSREDVGEEPKTRFNVGDRVRVRDDLEVGEMYGQLLTKDLKELLVHNDTMVIKEITKNNILYITDNGLYYTSQMLEPVNEERE